MPELPDIEIFKRLAERCVGRVVARAVVSDPGLIEGRSARRLQPSLKGRRVASVGRHGKHLLLGFAGNGCLAMHFGTNGSLQLVPKNGEAPRYVRLWLDFTDGDRLAYINPRRIGDVQLAADEATFIAAAGLGPDALNRGFDRAALERIVSGRKRDIKSVLMDQALVAGIGNIYSDEILFQARLYPGAPASTLDRGEIARLFAKIKDVLTAAIAHGAGSESYVERLPKGFLLRERHPGGHCPRCGAALATLKRSGRTSYYCHRCQKRRAPRA